MGQIRVLIIDDEQLAIDVLKHHFLKYDDFCIVDTFTDAVKALKFLTNHPIDIVFTDISMPRISGIELMKMCPQKTEFPLFVMVTSFSNYAIECFEIDVADYLLKPVSEERLETTIHKLRNLLQLKKNAPSTTSKQQKERESFFIKEGDSFIKVYIDEINYIEGMKDYIKIVVDDKKHIALKTLKFMTSFLSKFEFIRIHKSYLIPLKKITKYNNRFINIGKYKIPIGLSYRNKFKSFLEKKQI